MDPVASWMKSRSLEKIKGRERGQKKEVREPEQRCGREGELEEKGVEEARSIAGGFKGKTFK